jgi:NADH dehydrogenase FAD-containing subunit
MQGGAYAAKAILRKVKGQRKLPPFHYFDKGSLAVAIQNRTFIRGARLITGAALTDFNFLRNYPKSSLNRKMPRVDLLGS